MLGEAGSRTPRLSHAVLLGFVVGVLLGSLAVLVRSFIKRTWGA